MVVRSRSLTLLGPRELRWTEHDISMVEPHQVLVRTIACSISNGSEIPIYKGDCLDTIQRDYPLQMGYESYGEVIDAGSDVKRFSVGDKVVGFYGHQDYAVCEEGTLVSVPESIEPEVALLSILSCDAAKGVLKVQPRKSDRVLVTGLGTMGLLTVFFLRTYLRVEHIDAIDPDEKRCRLGDQFGVCHSYTPDRVPEAHYDVGFECSARNQAFQTLQTSMNRFGRICILSDGNYDNLTLNSIFFERELSVFASSDGWDYQKHAAWFFDHAAHVAYIKNLFQAHISSNSLIQCYADLANGVIRPVKVLVGY